MEKMNLENISTANLLAGLYDKTHDMRYELMLYGLVFSPEFVDEKIVNYRIYKKENDLGR